MKEAYMNDITFKVTYKNKEYDFEYGSEVFIFHTGIYRDMQKYGIKELLKYVSFVHACYLKDRNRTPLGDLADYIANNWKQVKKQDYYTVLDNFYIQY